MDVILELVHQTSHIVDLATAQNLVTKHCDGSKLPTKASLVSLWLGSRPASPSKAADTPNKSFNKIRCILAYLVYASWASSQQLV